MGNGWTPERRARQRALIRQWRPWEKSTGPRTDKGKSKAAGNSLKHGGRSLEWRETMKQMRDLLRQHRDSLQRVH